MIIFKFFKARALFNIAFFTYTVKWYLPTFWDILNISILWFHVKISFPIHYMFYYFSLFQFRKLIVDRDSCFKLVPSDYPVKVVKVNKINIIFKSALKFFRRNLGANLIWTLQILFVLYSFYAWYKLIGAQDTGRWPRYLVEKWKLLLLFLCSPNWAISSIISIDHRRWMQGGQKFILINGLHSSMLQAVVLYTSR